MELLDRFARGELESFEALFRQFQRQVAAQRRLEPLDIPLFFQAAGGNVQGEMPGNDVAAHHGDR